MTRGEKFPAGSRFVDGVGIDDADSFVLRDRIHLSEDGVIVAVVGLDELTAQLKSLKIVVKGLALDDMMVKEMTANLKNTLNQLDLRAVKSEEELCAIVKKQIKNYVFRTTKKNPMLLPVIMVV